MYKKQKKLTLYQRYYNNVQFTAAAGDTMENRDQRENFVFKQLRRRSGGARAESNEAEVFSQA